MSASPQSQGQESPTSPEGGALKSSIAGKSEGGSRKDRKGNLIQKGQASSHKLTFADQVVDRDALAEVHEVKDLWGDREGKTCCNCAIS
mmetsp:Transcript_51897/g.93107  ORF Transcript_51897/g.93107 Transcript_51897/m.93107 type:complete len:89 (+) Transcript_51897:69-335(+)